MKKRFNQLAITLCSLICLLGAYLYNNLTGKSLPQAHIPKEASELVAFTGKNFDVFEKETKYTVTFHRVVDGDTAIFEYNGHSFRARYLLIDAPETEKENSPAQPYAQEAMQLNETLLKQARKVEMAFDVGDYTDQYNRALVYVYVDSELLQNKLISEGLARVGYAYKPNVTLEPEMRAVQTAAKKKKINIWSIDGYVTDKGYQPHVYKSNR